MPQSKVEYSLLAREGAEIGVDETLVLPQTVLMQPGGSGGMVSHALLVGRHFLASDSRNRLQVITIDRKTRAAEFGRLLDAWR
jgi:hypothetical protein